jgi:hypothetical protein
MIDYSVPVCIVKGIVYKQNNYMVLAEEGLQNAAGDMAQPKNTQSTQMHKFFKYFKLLETLIRYRR